MLGMNLWGTIYNTAFMFGWAGARGYKAVKFCNQHPEEAWDIFLYCLCGAVGQNSIFLSISRFGSLTNTTITTTRKFVSIVVSKPLIEKAVGKRYHGLLGVVLPDLPQVEEVTEKAKEKKA
ncbi:UDP-galactose/UDP-glucose transporter 3-like [Actinidia eriantha]|uniref:UDP-galactose/UDP-glucose transporter 3-like n=1 Tax=Actinidia eriantha TaxID=165200 RepID=UPI00258E9D32|nr:UDP-galactose/UDP-glucose transporter 3-like [Actinidia eriantha]